VNWTMTLPHALDVLDTGVRIALHYGTGPGQRFADNILGGELDGDALGTPIAASPAAAGQGDVISQTVRLPTGVTCDYCTLQWVWAARNDNGFYIGCTDLAITADGALPDFDALPPAQRQEGNVLADLPGEVSPVTGGDGDGSLVGGPADPLAAEEDCGIGAGGGFGVGTLIGLVFTPLFLIFYGKYQQPTSERFSRQSRDRDATRDSVEMPSTACVTHTATPPPPSSAAGLPEGWAEMHDEATQRIYYYHTASGEASWTRP